MITEKLYRTLAVLPSSRYDAYISNSSSEFAIDSFRREFLGYFSFEDAIATVSKFIDSKCYTEPSPPEADGSRDTLEFSFVQGVYIADETRRSILARSLKNRDLSILQSVEVNLELASLGKRIVPTYSLDGMLLGYYLRDFACRKWGRARGHDRIPDKLTVNLRPADSVRFDLLSSQLLVQNHDVLGPSRQHTIALALKPLVSEKMLSSEESSSDLRNLYHLTVELNKSMYRVITKSGSFVGHHKELEVLELWGSYQTDDDKRVITLNRELSDEERKRCLTEELRSDRLNNGKRTLEVIEALRQIDDDIDGTIVCLFGGLVSKNKRSLISTIPNDSDWKSLFRRVKLNIEAVDHDPYSGGRVLSQIRSQFSSSNHGSFSTVVRKAISSRFGNSVALNGQQFDPDQVLTLALIGHREATLLLTRALLPNTSRNSANKNGRLRARYADNEGRVADALPEWARPQKSTIGEWAHKTLNGASGGRADVGVLVAKQVGSGQLNVLVFESALYGDICGAELPEQ